MRNLLLLTLVLMASCAPSTNSTQFGKTTFAELAIFKGEPLRVEAIPVEGGKILIYENNEKIQTQNDIVTNSFRDPKNDEINLIYWKHAFKDCEFIISQISEKTEGHELAEMMMKCDAQGIGVIYTDGSEIVSRILEYEKK